MILLLPTDTCYGIGCPITSESDYLSIYEMKGRGFEKPLAIVIRDFIDLRKFAKVTEKQIEFLRSYGVPFTVLVDRSPEFPFPPFLDETRYRQVAFRIAENCMSREITDQILFPIFLTSANRSGGVETYSLDAARAAFTEYLAEIECLDGGVLTKNPPSDIFRFVEGGGVEYVRRNYR